MHDVAIEQSTVERTYNSDVGRCLGIGGYGRAASEKFFALF